MSDELKTIDSSQLLELYNLGERNFNSIDLDDDDLSEVDLTGIHLR